MSDCPIGLLDLEPDGRSVRWAFALPLPVGCGPWFSLGVARAQTTLFAGKWGTDPHSWGLFFGAGFDADLCHNEQERRADPGDARE
jgi:hypothetical protein